MQFTQAEYAQARAVTALAYAKQRGYDLVRHGNCVLRLREHDSMILGSGMAAFSGTVAGYGVRPSSWPGTTRA